MADIFHTLQVRATASNVFAAISTPAGLDAWWGDETTGEVITGGPFLFHFRPSHDWRAIVLRIQRDELFELEFVDADADWTGSKVSFRLKANGTVTTLEFSHTGWKEMNEHFRISSYCWAMYLRLLKRYVEFGEEVSYPERLQA